MSIQVSFQIYFHTAGYLLYCEYIHVYVCNFCHFSRILLLLYTYACLLLFTLLYLVMSYLHFIRISHDTCLHLSLAVSMLEPTSVVDAARLTG